MAKNIIRICVVIYLFVISTVSYGQTTNNKAAFFIGDNEEYYHKLTTNHPTSLLEVCSNSMEKSYEEWSKTMREIENYCFNKGFDIKGAKLWINLFWEKDGSLKCIVFHEKPNSILLDYEKLRTLLSSYVEVSRQGIPYSNSYSHYGSVSFPVFNFNQRATEK